MDRQTLSIMKACEAVGVSRRTIYNWISAGKVEYIRTAGGSIRIFADSLWRDAGARADWLEWQRFARDARHPWAFGLTRHAAPNRTGNGKHRH
jgi:excisionase family DNA binding protein